MARAEGPAAQLRIGPPGLGHSIGFSAAGLMLPGCQKANIWSRGRRKEVSLSAEAEP